MSSAQVPLSRTGALVALAVTVLGLAAPGPALADGPYEGEWTATARRIGIELQSWGDDCPGGIPLRQTERGGSVRIRQSGDHLTFSGAVSGSTQGCWSDQPGLRRTGATVRGDTWTIRCSTPNGVAQGESGTYTFRAEGQDRIVFEESTRWDWSLRDSRCTATRRSRQTFTRVVEEAVAEPEEPEPADCTPGRPTRLILSPRRAELHPGERVCFRTRVTDAAGCRVPGQSVRLTLDADEGRSARLDGQCLFAGETAADAEGTFRVQATSGQLGASARITVAIDDLTDLVAQGTSSMVPTVSGDAEAAGASGVAARAAAGEGGFQLWWLGAGLGVLLLIGLSIVLVVRGRKGSPEEVEPAPMAPAAVAPMPTPAAADDPIRAAGATTQRPERICPVCDHEADADTEFCPNDGARLLDPESPEVKAQGMICPTCRRGYAAGSARCSADGDELLPYAFFVARQKHEDSAGKKVCPKCGTSYGPEKTFCGQDGTPLETVN